jgi:hypothetical protein
MWWTADARAGPGFEPAICRVMNRAATHLHCPLPVQCFHCRSYSLSRGFPLRSLLRSAHRYNPPKSRVSPLQRARASRYDNTTTFDTPPILSLQVTGPDALSQSASCLSKSRAGTTLVFTDKFRYNVQKSEQVKAQGMVYRGEDLPAKAKSKKKPSTESGNLATASDAGTSAGDGEEKLSIPDRYNGSNHCQSTSSDRSSEPTRCTSYWTVAAATELGLCAEASTNGHCNRSTWG